MRSLLMTMFLVGCVGEPYPLEDKSGDGAGGMDDDSGTNGDGGTGGDGAEGGEGGDGASRPKAQQLSGCGMAQPAVLGKRTPGQHARMSQVRWPPR